MEQIKHNLDEDPQFPHSPHKINRRIIIVAILFFALIVVGMFIFAFLKKTEMRQSSVPPVAGQEQIVL